MLAAVFGILSAMLMFAFLSNRGGSNSTVDQALNNSGAAESVLVVAQDIPFGTVITADMVSMQSLPKSAALEGRVSKSEDVVGKVATAPLYKGQQVVDRQFTTFEGQNTLAYKVPPGMRAVSLHIPNENWIVGGLPQPGDRIDFLAITTLSRTDPLTGQERPDVVAGIVAQDVQILAVSQKVVKTIPKLDSKTTTAADPSAASAVKPDSSAKPLDDGATYEKALSITLALPPDLAAKISLVDALKNDVGQYRLLLRRQGESEPLTGTTTWGYDDLFPAKKK
jgi:Flp pilus assembly protein CpaB